MEVAHAHLTEVPRMELVEQDTVVVETTGVAATGRMLAVLPDTAMAGRHVPALFAVLVQTGRLHRSAHSPHMSPKVGMVMSGSTKQQRRQCRSGKDARSHTRHHQGGRQCNKRMMQSASYIQDIPERPTGDTGRAIAATGRGLYERSPQDRPMVKRPKSPTPPTHGAGDVP